MKAPPTTLCKSVLHSYVQKRCSISCCIVLALDRARCTQANDSAGTYFNSPSNTQTKCRNELSLQNGTAISELGLDFVITCSSIDAEPPSGHGPQSLPWSNRRHSIYMICMTCMQNQQKGQTKCRNKSSLQNGKAISELGLDFVIIFTCLLVLHISQNPTNKVRTVSYCITHESSTHYSLQVCSTLLCSEEV